MDKFLEERKEDLLIQQKEQAQSLLHYIEENEEPDQTIIQHQTNRLNRLSAQIFEIKMIQRKVKRELRLLQERMKDNGNSKRH